jgi:hypothetical protein
MSTVFLFQFWRNPPAAAAPAGLVAGQVGQPLRQLQHDHVTLGGRVRHPAGDFVTRPAASDAKAGLRLNDAQLDARALDLRNGVVNWDMAGEQEPKGVETTDLLLPA